MKAGLMLALSNKTRAQTLPEWDEKRLISSSVRSGWTTLAMDRKTSWILFPVRYLVMPIRTADVFCCKCKVASRIKGMRDNDRLLKKLGVHF
jgi:hypothetical protein